MKKYAFIQRHKLVRPICVQCRVLQVSVSGYHEHLARRRDIDRRRRPAGQTPVLDQRGRHHKKVSAVAALCVSPDRDPVRLYFRLYPGKEVDADRSIAFLKALNRELDAHWRLVWDRLNAHRANKTLAYLETASRLRTFFFPYGMIEVVP